MKPFLSSFLSIVVASALRSASFLYSSVYLYPNYIVLRTYLLPIALQILKR
jgi:hypothetical protein